MINLFTCLVINNVQLNSSIKCILCIPVTGRSWFAMWSADIMYIFEKKSWIYTNQILAATKDINKVNCQEDRLLQEFRDYLQTWCQLCQSDSFIKQEGLFYSSWCKQILLSSRKLVTNMIILGCYLVIDSKFLITKF